MLALASFTTAAALSPLPPAVPVFFQPWSAALDASALKAIATAAKVAKDNPTEDVLVTGAADSVGSKQANIYMSETRAQVVADQLVVDGVSQDRIRTKADGIVPSPTPTGTYSQFARRVLIQVGG
jgi:outer membrane protein OmpA-like peptidoglycan-associated protein